MDIVLVEKKSTKTSRGMLSKAWYKIDGMLYMVKGNSIDYEGNIGYEPYSEVMASCIAEVLEFNHVKYSLLPSSLFPEIKVFGIPFVSVCPSFITPREVCIKFADYEVYKEGEEPSDHLGVCLKYLPTRPLYEMLVLDALIGNVDRHLNNFDVIITEDGVEKLSPLYDHGASLLSWVPSSELSFKSSIGKYDKSKPFRSTHKKQIKLVESPVLQYSREDELYNTIIHSISHILHLLNIERSKSICKYLHWRMKYVSGVMIK